MKTIYQFAALLALGLLFTSSIADQLPPPCGLLCIREQTLNSTCSLANTTCICTNEELGANITACVFASCTVRESLSIPLNSTASDSIADFIATMKYSMNACGVVPRDRTKTIMSVGVTFDSLAILVFGLRLMSKLTGSGGPFGLDDFIIAFVACLLVPFGMFSIKQWQITDWEGMFGMSLSTIFRTYFARIYFFGELTYLCVLPLTKISILCFYLRIFPRQRFQYCVWALIAANGCYLITFEVISIFQCSPINGAWKRWDGEYPTKCNDVNLQGWLSATLNIILDLFILTLPIPELYKLSMSPKKKFHILLVFSVGFFVTVVSVLRLRSLMQFANTINITQDYVDLTVWSNIELTVGVVCACMPSIRPLFSQLIPTMFSPTTKAEPSDSSSMPEIGILSNTPGPRRHSFETSNVDHDSFVKLVEVASPRGTRV